MSAHDPGGVNGTRSSSHYWWFQMGWSVEKNNNTILSLFFPLVPNFYLRTSRYVSVFLKARIVSPLLSLGNSACTIPMMCGWAGVFLGCWDKRLSALALTQRTGDLLLLPHLIQMSQSCMRNTLFGERGVLNRPQSWGHNLKGFSRRIYVWECQNIKVNI